MDWVELRGWGGGVDVGYPTLGVEVNGLGAVKGVGDKIIKQQKSCLFNNGQHF